MGIGYIHAESRHNNIICRRKYAGALGFFVDDSNLNATMKVNRYFTDYLAHCMYSLQHVNFCKCFHTKLCSVFSNINNSLNIDQLWSNDAIWQHRTWVNNGSGNHLMPDVKHYLDLCWLIFNKVPDVESQFELFWGYTNRFLHRGCGM